MVSTFVQRATFLAALSICSVAQAAPTSLSAGQVNIDYDTDGFYFARDTSAFGGISTEEISSSLFSFQAVSNGIEIDFNNALSVYASSYFDFYPQTLTGSFNAFFNFTPAAGYAITGYTLTYSGDYSVETPGNASLGDVNGVSFTQYLGGSGFTATATVSGPNAPNIQGGFSAFGDITTIQVFDGYDTYIDHYEDVLDYCEDNAEPPICYYHQEPVYVSQPIYHDETDLGEASINLRKVTLTANVVAVPEPGALALLGLGVPVAVWWARRRRV